MNISNHFKICHKCRNRINSYGHPVYKIFSYVLDNHFKNNYIFFDSSDCEVKKCIVPITRFLEKKRIIITRELHSSLSIINMSIMENYRFFNGNKYLCWCQR